MCTATADEALKQSVGCDGQPGSYADVNHADTIALFGHNVAETQPVLWMRMLDRLEGPNPPRLLVVDPRRTVVAGRADVLSCAPPGAAAARAARHPGSRCMRIHPLSHRNTDLPSDRGPGSAARGPSEGIGGRLRLSLRAVGSARGQ